MPLREGGSLPAIVEADNLGTYVLKFRGAGQGTKALAAEIICGELARRLGLRTPELALGYLDPRIPASEPDPEIQDLMRASSGLNLAVDFLPGSAGFDPRRGAGRLRAAAAGPGAAGAGGDPLMSTEAFEYAVIRVVPRVERGESMNAGVILYSHRHRYLDCRMHLDTARLRALDPTADPDAVAAALAAIQQACRAGEPGAEAAAQPPGARFRWLTAPRSTIVQPGPVHSGLTADPAAELDHLFDKLVR